MYLLAVDNVTRLPSTDSSTGYGYSSFTRTVIDRSSGIVPYCQDDSVEVIYRL